MWRTRPGILNVTVPRNSAHPTSVRHGVGFLLRTLLLLASALSATIPTGFAAEPSWHRVTTWTAEDGLPNGEVRCLAPARSGGFWVGTAGGLVRFDGVRFIPEPLPRGLLLRNVRVTCVAETPDRRLWVGTEGHFLGGKAGDLRVADSDLPVAGIRPTHLLVTVEGLWMTSTNGVFLRTSDRWLPVAFPPGLMPPILGLHADSQGGVWLTTPGGHAHWSRGDWEVFPGDEGPLVGGHPDRNGGFVVFERQRNRWFRGKGTSPAASSRPGSQPALGGVVTQEGIWLLHGKSVSLEAFPDGGTSGAPPTRFEVFPFQDPRVAVTDADNNVWIGLDGDGLVRITPQVARKWDSRSRLSSNIRWLGGAPDGRHVVVKPRSEEIFFLDVPSPASAWRPGPVVVRRMPTPGVADQALGLNRSEAWIAAGSNTLVHAAWPRNAGGNRTNVAPVGKIFTVWTRRNGDAIAVAAKAIGFVHGEAVDWWIGPAFGSARSWIETEDGLLLGTDNGIWKIEDEAGRRCRRLADVDPVRSMAQDPMGRIWVGTFNRSVMVVDPTGREAVRRIEEVPEPLVEQIQVDSAGRVWLATQAGLFWADSKAVLAAPPGTRGLWRRVSLAVGEFRDAFLEGFPPTSGVSADGSLWFGMYRGVVQVFPERTRLFESQPELRLQRIVGQGARRDFLPLERLSHDSRTLEVSFQDASLTAPQLATFRVRDAGTDWRPIGSQGRWVASFPGAGRHRFEVEMSDHLGRVVVGAVDVVVDPPWWRQGWFLTLSVLLTGGTVAGIVAALRYRYRLLNAEAQRQLLAQRQRIGQDLHDSLGAELARIGYLGGLPTPPPPEAIAGGLARMRESLDEIVWAVNPAKDNLESFLAFLSHVSSRLLEGTDVRLDLQMPEAVPSVEMPPRIRHNLLLSAREAIANALRHAGPRCIRVRVSLAAPDLELEVLDDGVGFDPLGTDPNRNGLQNIRRRLQEIGGSADIVSSPGSGTSVRCRVPMSSFQNVP